MNPNRVYESLVDWLRKSWWDLPESDDLIPIIRSRCTPREAELMIGMPFSGRSLEDLSQAKGIDAHALEAELAVLCAKGLVFRSTRGTSVRYRLNDSYFSLLRAPFWAGREDDPGSEFANRINRYFRTGLYDQYAEVPEKGLRVLPINKTIEDPRQILPYEDAINFLAGQREICVATCPCRHRKHLDPEAESCTHSTEVCLHFGSLARYMVDHDMGRPIDGDEAQEILRECAEEGLVHAISNWVDGVDSICNCCSCCCVFFEAYHVLKHSRSLDPSNYVVHVTTETCQGCGLCVKRCPMNALTLESTPQAWNKKGKAAVLDADACIGCGVCAYKCPSESLVLRRRERIVDPPQNPREYTMRYLAYREEAERKKDS
ncbi:MAG: 4Fe-4S binding protein [Desulfomonilaceae bacterium]|nr:4Fe-4S binding protein [Desulfomonilaceae bacterium]